MKIIIHVGMPKTGSSSIQHTFTRLRHSNLEYFDWSPGGNHSDLFVLLFEDEANIVKDRRFRTRGSEFVRKLPALREELYERVSAQLAGASGKIVMFSGEGISARHNENAIQRMRDFFATWSNDVSVIGYIRPPGGFMISAFQQRLKGGAVPNVSHGGASPHYRARFEKMDRFFGRDTVRLKEFSPHSLLKGDVVQDFAREVGLGVLEEDKIIRTNESLSLEAVALLYVQRKMGQGFVRVCKHAGAANAVFISRLATIGGRKFAFSPKMLAPILERESDDIAWMEERLANPFSDSVVAHTDAISSLDDLVDIAQEQLEAVQDLLGDEAVQNGPSTIETLVHAMDRLREQSHTTSLARNTRRSLQQKTNSPMATKTDRLRATKEELAMHRKLAAILWTTDHKDDMPSDKAERKAALALVRKNYHRKALDLIRHLRNNNLKIVETESKD